LLGCGGKNKADKNKADKKEADKKEVVRMPCCFLVLMQQKPAGIAPHGL
jgi:hypothetical protein